jgi:hypothetical protein
MQLEADIDEQLVKDTIDQYSSTKLAEMVVAYRYLGVYRDLAIVAMEELAKRRGNGDPFEYEGYIKEKLEAMPKLEFKVPETPDLFGFLKKAMGTKR